MQIKKQQKRKFNLLKHFGKYLKKEWVFYLFVLILSLFSSAIGVGGSVVIQYAVTYTQLQDFKTVSIICGTLLGIFLIDWLFLYFQYFIVIKIGQRVSHRIRLDLYNKINQLPISFFDQNKAGKIISNFTNDAMAISTLLSDSLTDIIGNLVYFFGVIFGMFFISTTLTVISIVGITIILCIMFFLLKRSEKHFIGLQHALSDITAFLDEHLSAQSLIDIYNQQDQIMNEFKKINKKTSRIGYLSEVYSSLNIPVVLSLTNILTAIITIIGVVIIIRGDYKIFAGLNVNFDPENLISQIPEIPGIPHYEPAYLMNTARLTVFLILLRNALSPLTQMTQVFSIIMTAKAGANRIADVLAQKDEYYDYENIAISIVYDKYKENLKINDKNLLILEPSIEFKNVSFGYLPDKLVLKDISFKINKGDTIGIVGPTGSGKSTIINLINKMYSINSGEILIDNQSIENVDKNSLRKNISMVLQDTYFLDKTIKENLLLAKPNATDQEIQDACKLANCHDLIIKLKDGYDTKLQNNADIFSKGEKQLISIARAILHDVNLLIFDEATSSIDSKTEKQIQQAIEQLQKNKTSIMIAHRLSTIRHATKILVIKDGELLESGNHDELIALNGFYAKLYNSQLNVVE